MSLQILDGGMGQELIARSQTRPTPLWATQILMDRPDIVQAVHYDYFLAGADITTTNSYAIHRDRLANNGVETQFKDLHIRACEMANRARDQFGGGIIAGSSGPTGASYRPDLTLEPEQGAEIYAEIAEIQKPYVDLFLLETLSSIKQAHGAVLGMQTAGKPVWLSVTIDDNNGSLLRSGEPIADLIPLAETLKVDALLLNCSTPEAITQGIPIISTASMPFGAYANGFTKISEAFKQHNPTVESLTARKELNPEAYLNFARQWRDTGASIIGGCCEVSFDHIKTLADNFAGTTKSN